MLRIIKFALPLAAIVCFGTIGVQAETNSSKKSSKTSETARKKSSSSKKSSKARKSSKTTKSKSKKASAKSKAKAERTVAETSSSNDWIDELPPVELPEVDGPAEDELLEPVPDNPEVP